MEKIGWTPEPNSAWYALTASKPNLGTNGFVPTTLWGYIDYNDVQNTARWLNEDFYSNYTKNPENFKEGVGLLNPAKAEVDFFEFAEKSGRLPDWWITPARQYIQRNPSLSQYLEEKKDIKPVGRIEFNFEGYKPLKPSTVTEYTIRKDKEYQETLAYLRSPEYLRLQKEATDRAIGASSVEEAKIRLWNEIGSQRDLLAQKGINWSGGIPDSQASLMMAEQLANAGVKTISDLEIKKIKTGDEGVEQNALINKRTGQAMPPNYAFAQMGDTGGTWGGTFAGEGSTRFNINFVDGVPVFTAQQQATVKSGAEKLAGVAVPIALGLALGPAGLGLSSTAAGALAGGVGGLLKSGDIEDAVEGAALGGVLGYGKEALFGAGTAASDLAQIEASMGTPSLLGSSNILDVINQAPITAVEPVLSMTPPPVINEPVLVPGDTALTGTLAQPPLTVENIAGQLTPEAQALMLSPTLPVTPLVVETPAGVLSPDTANIINTTAVEGSMTPVTTGDPTKAALYSNEGYGPLSDLTVTGAPITSSPITSLGPAATLKDVTDYLTGGGFAGSVTDALKEAFKAATGGGQQQGSGSNFLGPIIGGLLSRSPTASPSASVTPGRPVDITSPIQSLLAPKLVQQRPVTLL